MEAAWGAGGQAVIYIQFGIKQDEILIVISHILYYRIRGVDTTQGNLFKKILIATDGSENVRNAVSYGIGIAKATGADVHALYVITTEHAATARSVMGWTEAFEKYLADRGEIATGHVEKLGKDMGVRVEPVVLKGSPAAEILDYAEKNDVDLIVMGTQGLTGIKRFLIGSVAENVLRHSKVPVMVVR